MELWQFLVLFILTCISILSFTILFVVLRFLIRIFSIFK